MTEMRRHFTDAELVELGLITGAFIMLGRLHRTFGVAPMGPRRGVPGTADVVHRARCLGSEDPPALRAQPS